VEACPPSRTYRFRKFARRNKAALATAAILVLASLGLAVSNFLMVRQRDRANALATSEQRHRKEAERQQDRANRLQREAEHQTELAQQGFQRAQAAVNEYLTKVSENELLDQPGLHSLRKDLLEWP